MPDTNMPNLKFGIGQSVPRQEDPVLLKGQGRYTDDLARPGQVYAVMVRSAYAHGLIKGIDTAAARAMPGVSLVATSTLFNSACGYTERTNQMCCTPWTSASSVNKPCPLSNKSSSRRWTA